jgi:branched-chain amino acid transport system permease protein
VSWGLSGEVILMTLVGGIGTVFGPVIGAAFIITMQNYLTGLAQWVPVVQGTIFIVVVVLFQRGIAGEIGEALRRMKRRQAAKAQAARGT